MDKLFKHPMFDPSINIHMFFHFLNCTIKFQKSSFILTIESWSSVSIFFSNKTTISDGSPLNSLSSDWTSLGDSQDQEQIPEPNRKKSWICCEQCYKSYEAMKCFQFYNGVKKEPKRNSVNSSYTSHEKRQSQSELNSRDRLNTIIESRGSSPFPSLFERPSNLKVFTLLELKQVTKNFSTSAKLGEGGFGCVFKGVIKSSEDPAMKIDVAVKQLGGRGRQGHKEWVNEVNVLGVVEHPNLVKLIGYCAEDDERGIQRLLIYEYMPNRSVDDHLSDRSPEPLPWNMRLRIARDAARGLTYLHEEMDFQIIFRDFKSSNILLDEQWNAKLSDFGLARLGPSEGRTHVSTAVVGTMGYAAPEYLRTGHLTAKSDVWSYGVFLYELITGRRPMDRNRPKSEQKLLQWIKPYLSDTKKFHHILDRRLEEKQQILRSAIKLSLVANRCLGRLPKTRPKMSEVLEMVNEVMERR